METRIYCCYIVFSALLCPYLMAKPFSLNEAIDSEDRDKQDQPTSASTAKEAVGRLQIGKQIQLIKPKTNINKLSESIFTRNKKISPLKYRSTYQIKNPLKPKRLKYSHIPKYKRRNQSLKRETNGNEIYNQKYIPLLRSLSMLFDNILNSDSSEHETSRKTKHKRNRYYANEDDVVCSCSAKSESRKRTSTPQEKAATVPTTLQTEVPPTEVEITSFTETTTAPTYHTADDNIHNFRRYKNVPLLLARDTSSIQRNNHGLRERNGATHHRSFKRHFTWDNGDNESFTRIRTKSDSEYNENNTDGNTRDNTGTGFRRRLRGDRAHTKNTKDRRAKPDILATNEAPGDGGQVVELERQNQHEVGGDETESTSPVSEFSSRLRRPDETTELPHADEINKEDNISITNVNTSHKGITVRNGTNTTESQKAGRTDETVIPTHYFNYTYSSSQNKSKGKAPVIMIFDGYSVARDINGENKLAEKSVRVHS